MTTAHAPLARGGHLLEALTTRDFGALHDCLDPGLRFRALLPPGPVELGRDDAAARFRRWFGGPDDMEVVDATVGGIGEAAYLRWRMRLTARDGSARLIEQHAFVRGEDRLTGVDLLCSGFVAGGAR